MARFVFSVFLSIVLLISGSPFANAQAISEDGLFRSWFYVNPVNLEAMLVNSLDYETVSNARVFHQSEAGAELAEIFIVSPAPYKRHYFEDCYAFNGKSTESEWGDFAWFYGCQVDNYIFTVVLYGRDTVALTEVVQGVIEYGSPEPPTGWDDATELLYDSESNTAENSSERLQFDESWSFVHEQRQSRTMRIYRSDHGTRAQAGAYLEDNFYQMRTTFLRNSESVHMSRMDSKLESCIAATGDDRFTGSGDPSVLIQCSWGQYVITLFGTDIPYAHVETWAIEMLETFDPMPRPGFIAVD